MLEGDMATPVMSRFGAPADQPLDVRPVEPILSSTTTSSSAAEVHDSWRRCVAEHHVDPRSRTAPNVITQSELKVSSEPLADVILHAREEIDRLYAIVRQQGYVVLLCNGDGVAQENDISLLPHDRVETIDFFPGVQDDISQRLA